MIISLLVKSLLCLVINFVYLITNKINKISVKQKILMINHSFSLNQYPQRKNAAIFLYKMNASVNPNINEHLIQFWQELTSKWTVTLRRITVETPRWSRTRLTLCWGVPLSPGTCPTEVGHREAGSSINWSKCWINLLTGR